MQKTKFVCEHCQEEMDEIEAIDHLIHNHSVEIVRNYGFEKVTRVIT